MLRSGFSVSRVADERMYQAAIDEHENIVRALKERDLKKANEAVVLHTEKGKERLLLALDGSYQHRLTFDL